MDLFFIVDGVPWLLSWLIRKITCSTATIRDFQVTFAEIPMEKTWLWGRVILTRQDQDTWLTLSKKVHLKLSNLERLLGQSWLHLWSFWLILSGCGWRICISTNHPRWCWRCWYLDHTENHLRKAHFSGKMKSEFLPVKQRFLMTSPMRGNLGHLLLCVCHRHSPSLSSLPNTQSSQYVDLGACKGNRKPEKWTHRKSWVNS